MVCHGKKLRRFRKNSAREKKEDLTLFFLRVLPIMPLSVVSGVAGIMEMNFKRYSVATFLGVIPRNLLLAILGFSFGEFYHLLAGKIDYAETIMTVILVSLILAYIIGQKFGLFDKIRKLIF